MLTGTRFLAWSLVTACAVLPGAGCKKEKKQATDAPVTDPAMTPPATDPSATAPATDPAMTPPATDPAMTPPATDPSATAPATDPAAAGEDFILVEARHEPTKEGDPVVVHFKGFKVVKADFDPAKVEGGKAELEIDLGSVDSGIPKRDDHLKSPDYFDSAKTGVAKVSISGVKKGAEADSYTAKAKVDVHGVKQTMDVKFQVVEKLPDGIKIKAEQPLKRSLFKVGKAKGDGAADDLVLKLALTIKKPA